MSEQASSDQASSEPGTSDQASSEPGTIEVEIDRERCMGSGNCSYWAPGVFDLDEDGIAVVVGDPAGHEDRVELAAEHCPTVAITIRRR